MGCRKTFEKIFGIIIALLIGVGIVTHPNQIPWLISETTIPKPAPTLTQISPTVTPTLTSNVTRPEPGSVCAYDPIVEALEQSLSQENWINWIKMLSGEEPVTIKGETTTIETRFSESLFDGSSNARAYEFVADQLRQWGYEDNVTLFEEAYRPATFSDREFLWKNLIVVIPGSDPELAHEQVLMTAHLDSITSPSPELIAPGADDNATGVATLLEAARAFRELSFKRTIKLVFFTGEELGLLGSQAYTVQHEQELADIFGVFNLDMFGYDGDNDHCFEIHAGLLQSSNQVGGCLADTIEIYEMGIKFDYLTDQARESSDHVSFWESGVGAVEVLENFSTHGIAGGCDASDMNPNYHTEGDLTGAINQDTAHAIARAAIMAVAKLAQPVGI